MNSTNYTTTELLKMFESQMWCLGVDIMRKEGNLLLEYGFSRERPPGRYRHLSSRYTGYQAGATIVLWSFQVACFRDSQCVLLLRRQQRDALILPDPRVLHAVWHPDQKFSQGYPLGESITARVNANMGTLGKFFVAYEQWVERLCGSNYRRAIIERQPRRNPLLKRETLHDFWMKVVHRETAALVV